MRLAMAQMQCGETVEENLEKAVRMMEQAREAGSDLIFFPEVQFSPFFPKRQGADASRWLMELDHPAVRKIRETCRRLRLWASPNLYLAMDGSRRDASLLIDSNGELAGISGMVHITQTAGFYEQDYYAPSDTGFRVYETPFGKIGIVICFDRHIPCSIHACAVQGASLILVPTANLVSEPMELFTWEMRVQAFQSTVYVAMCNRVGVEEECVFSGASMVAAPDGSLVYRADGREQLCVTDIPLEQADAARRARPWLDLFLEQRSRQT